MGAYQGLRSFLADQEEFWLIIPVASQKNFLQILVICCGLHASPPPAADTLRGAR
jgi:hypothetical protein